MTQPTKSLGVTGTGFHFKEALLFETSKPGRTGCSLPDLDVPEVDSKKLLGEGEVRDHVAGFPQVTEPEVVRHFTRLSSWNFSIDNAFYPLGSCTMKHNPRVNEVAARISGLLHSHPLAPSAMFQGSLQLMYDLGRYLAEIVGLDEVTLQPAAGAQGELTGLLMIRAFHQAKGENRKTILIPDSAHGTNPASTAICGYKVVRIATDKRGNLDVDSVKSHMDKTVAGIMITNPNTLGLYEENIVEICKIVHSQGGLVYGDGANLNALLGKCRPGDLGIDLLHINLHKTFTTPHGGGGPGAGPVAVRKDLEPFLPIPLIKKEAGLYTLDFDQKLSIGKVRSFFGNYGMFIRAYTYIRELGPDGLKRVTELAVLNANYLKATLEDSYHLPYKRTPLHEVIFTDKNLKPHGIKTMDVAKRLIDYGFHPPTVYFPLVVDGALMMEPTETENKETLDAFVEALKAIQKEATTNPDLVKQAPQSTHQSRLDEVLAAKKPRLRWTAD